MNKQTAIAAMLAAGLAHSAWAEEPGMVHGGMMDHGAMSGGGAMQEGAARGQGVINSVDSGEGVVNISHGPIPSLSWPEMTMDLPVTDQVDLGAISPGDIVDFRIVLGADNVYRIVEMETAN